jgi:hypothetical protein|tara:strand:- start:45 stop:461 length:417 start_codon:yes stop_codon:yes gene_type:complete
MSRRIRNGEWGVLLSSRFMSIKKNEREILINNLSVLTPELFGYHEKEREHCKTIIRAQCKCADEGFQDWENYIGNFYTWEKLKYKTNKDLQTMFNQFVRDSDPKCGKWLPLQSALKTIANDIKKKNGKAKWYYGRKRD